VVLPRQHPGRCCSGYCFTFLEKPRQVSESQQGAFALTTNTAALTGIGNDYGCENMFARQVEALGGEGDIAVGISTSGESPNVLKALAIAKT
jgi:phosphoheptose isomerase